MVSNSVLHVWVDFNGPVMSHVGLKLQVGWINSQETLNIHTVIYDVFIRSTSLLFLQVTVHQSSIYKILMCCLQVCAVHSHLFSQPWQCSSVVLHLPVLPQVGKFSATLDDMPCIFYLFKNTSWCRHCKNQHGQLCKDFMSSIYDHAYVICYSVFVTNKNKNSIRTCISFSFYFNRKVIFTFTSWTASQVGRSPWCELPVITSCFNVGLGVHSHSSPEPGLMMHHDILYLYATKH